MFVYTLKATTLKYIGVMAFCMVAIVATVLLVPDTYHTYEVETMASTADFKNIKSEEDRINLLKSLGFEIDRESLKVDEIIIPEEFDSVYEEYNQIQKEAGFNLEKYKGKKAKRYTYVITNYENNIPALVNIIIYKNRVIGADVSSPDMNGFIHGLKA